MSLHEKQAMLADMVTVVAKRLSGGLYICGRPGTGKTHLVRSTLKANKMSFRYQQGQANPLPLFDEIEDSPDGIHVLDDTTELFKNPRGLQILKAMLGKQRDGSRVVTYHMGKQRRRVDFTGGLIAISNESNINAALKSRVTYVPYDLTDDEMNLLLDEIASQGYPNDHSNLTAAECSQCVAELRKIQQELANEQKPVRLHLRHLTHHAYVYYLAHKIGDLQVDWRVHLRTILRQDTSTMIQSQADELADEAEVLKQIVASHPIPGEQVKAWQRRTGKSRQNFYLKKKQLRL